jgi:hypothetical protein
VIREGGGGERCGIGREHATERQRTNQSKLTARTHTDSASHLDVEEGVLVGGIRGALALQLEHNQPAVVAWRGSAEGHTGWRPLGQWRNEENQRRH